MAKLLDRKCLKAGAGIPCILWLGWLYNGLPEASSGTPVSGSNFHSLEYMYALPIDGGMGERKTRGQSSGCSFALHIPCAVPAMMSVPPHQKSIQLTA